MNEKAIIPMEQKEKLKTTVSKQENGMTTSVTVEEIENGFLITTDTYGDKDGKYISICKKEYSKTNPLKEEKEEEESTKLGKAVSGLLDSLSGAENMINV